MDGKSLRHQILRLLAKEQPLATLLLLAEKLGKTVNGRGSKHKIHVGVTALDLLAAMLLRYHATADRDHHIGTLRLEMLKLSYNGERLFFGMLPNSAGVHRDQIGILGG